ncbi:MAG: TRAP transporter small permease subunit [Deltaproteobacteria bacterium]|nr:TRAP transporter small permease subunit [Deltaproteobacteria bacterium]
MFARNALRLFSDSVSNLSNAVGTAAAWLYPVLVVVMIINVALRYGLGRGFIELEELQWHLFAAAFLLGFAYTYVANEHVRADILAARLTPRARAWIELLGCLLLLFPFALIVTVYAFDFFLQSFQLGERSEMPSGLPYRWIIKAVLFLALALLSLQSLGTAAKQALVLWPEREER